MKIPYKYIIMISAILVMIIAVVVALEVLVGQNITELAVNPANGNLAIPTYSSVYSKVVITDMDLNRIIDIPLNGINHIPVNSAFSHDGSKLYVTVADMAQTGYEIDYQEWAYLAVVDTSTWSVTYYDLPHYPNDIYVPAQNDIIYITCGLWRGKDPSLVKLNTANGTIIQQITYDGDIESGGLVTMNYNESKLYIDAGQTRKYTTISDEILKLSVLRVYDTNLQYIKSLNVTPGIADMIHAPGNKLFIAHAELDDYDSNVYKCLTVLDTIQDEIEMEFEIPNVAARKLVYDIVKSYLYISPLVPEEIYDGDMDWTYTSLFPINSIIRLDLSDWSYSLIEVANETVGPIALSPDGNRLYAAAVNTNSKKMYYVDLF